MSKKTAVGALNQAKEATVEASSIVHDAITWIGPHIVLVVALSCALLLAATYGIECHILSSTLGDIEALKKSTVSMTRGIRSGIPYG